VLKKREYDPEDTETLLAAFRVLEAFYFRPLTLTTEVLSKRT
jgi:hypothetical protein